MSIGRKIGALAIAFAVVLAGAGVWAGFVAARVTGDAAAGAALDADRHALRLAATRVEIAWRAQSAAFERAVRVATGRAGRSAGLYLDAVATFERAGTEVTEGLHAVWRASADGATWTPPQRAHIQREVVRLERRWARFQDDAQLQFQRIEDRWLTRAPEAANEVDAQPPGFPELAQLWGAAPDARRARGLPVELLRATGVGLLLLGLLVVTGTLAVAQSARESLDSVTRVAEQISLGKRGVRFPKVRPDETGRLLTAVHVLVRTIDALEIELICKERELVAMRESHRLSRARQIVTRTGPQA